MLAPALRDRGGIQKVQEIYRDALGDMAADNGARVEVCAWKGPFSASELTCEAPVNVIERHAGGSRVRFALMVFSALILRRWRHVFVLHVDLAPVALVASLGGFTASYSVVLYGIEAWRKMGMIKLLALRRARKVISISEFTSAKFKESNGKFRCSVINPSLPRGWFEKTERYAREVDPSIVLMAGRMSVAERYKGFDEMLECLSMIWEAFPDARYVIVGDGDDRQRLMKKTVDLGIESRVEWRGWVSEEDLLDLYARCGFFALPSEGEGFGLVYAEALSFGKPVIVGSGDAGREFVSKGGRGWAVNPRSRDELCKVVVEGLRAARGQTAADRAAVREWARKHLGFSAFAESLRRDFLDSL